MRLPDRSLTDLPFIGQSAAAVIERTTPDRHVAILCTVRARSCTSARCALASDPRRCTVGSMRLATRMESELALQDRGERERSSHDGWRAVTAFNLLLLALACSRNDEAAERRETARSVHDAGLTASTRSSNVKSLENCANLDCERRGYSCCDGRCVNTANDPLDCGGCGIACEVPSNYCESGRCRPPPCQAECSDGTVCCGSTCCGSGELCCFRMLGPWMAQCTRPVNGTCPQDCPSCQ